MEILRHARCFGCGEPGDDRMDRTWRWDEARGRVTGEVTFGARAQGPPRHVHGGSLATLLDEAMGLACWMGGTPCVCANLNVSYRNLVPLHGRVHFEAWVEGAEGRKLTTRSQVVDADGRVLTECSGLFIAIPPEKVPNLRDMTLDERARRWQWEGEASTAARGVE